MKKKNFLFATLILAVAFLLNSCFHHHHDISVHINDDEDVYRMRANFDEDQTREVQRIINAHLQQHHSLSLIHGYTDEEITLADGTNFYIKSAPGRLKINIDKTENPEEGCENVKEMCDEISNVLAGKKKYQ